MNSIQLTHVPNYFQFFVIDPLANFENLKYVESRLFDENRIFCVDGIVVIGVKSEYSPIVISVYYYDEMPDKFVKGDWDRIVECSLKTNSKEIVFFGCATESFGSLPVEVGNYRLRIYYGGQDSVRSDGSSMDFYAIEIWPSQEDGVVILKP